MTEEEKKERKIEYMKRYRSNPEVKEREKEQRRQRYAKPEVKEREKEHMKEYHSRPEVKERRKEHMKEYRSKPEVKERQKEYYANPHVKERMKEYGKEYVKLFGGDHHRRAAKRGNYAERVKRIEIFKRDKFKCFYCKKKLKLDDCILEHKIPIAKGGSNTPENCTTSCRTCNVSKGAKLLPGLQISIFDTVKE